MRAWVRVLRVGFENPGGGLTQRRRPQNMLRIKLKSEEYEFAPHEPPSAVPRLIVARYQFPARQRSVVLFTILGGCGTQRHADYFYYQPRPSSVKKHYPPVPLRF